jgi:hypothetical protein
MSRRIFLLAVALLTYGRLEVVADILENMPGERNPARHLARVVDDLLPLPQGMDAVARTGEVLAWVRAHGDELRWNEDAGRFERA